MIGGLWKLLEELREGASAARPRAVALGAWLWKHRQEVGVVLLVVLVLLIGRAWRHASELQHQLEDARARQAGEARAAAAQVPVVQAAPQAVVDEEAEKAKRENPVLRAELERAEKELGKLRVQLVARVRTEPTPAAAPPRAAQPAGEPPRPALLLAGDQLDLRADLVVARSKDGAHLLEGTLSAYRVLDGEALAVRAFSAPLTFAAEAPSAEPCQTHQDRLWRVGPVGGASGQGWMVGGAYTRRLELWGWTPEVMVTAAGGPGGVSLLAGSLF